MSLVLLHDLDGEEVLVNTDALNAAVRKHPDEESVIKDSFTKLYYIQREKGMEGVGFPDAVKESPAEIFTVIQKS